MSKIKFQLQSSNIVGGEFDPKTRILILEFKGGSRYQYDDVPGDVASNLFLSESPGSYFAASVKPWYECTKLEPVKPKELPSAGGEEMPEWAESRLHVWDRGGWSGLAADNQNTGDSIEYVRLDIHEANLVSLASAERLLNDAISELYTTGVEVHRDSLYEGLREYAGRNPRETKEEVTP